MDVTEFTVKQIILWRSEPAATIEREKAKFDPLLPLRKWLDNLPIRDEKLAHRLCTLIPAQCPFHRQIKVLGKTWFTIPPLCKLNPLYEQLVSLRFRALCYLSEECGQDVRKYC